ncbi:MAG TPA: hypothetical protein VGS80_25435 [Ktedonobacterales bacterium]|nr:hypothetical protein [Ktedonobacterales bacterium]
MQLTLAQLEACLAELIAAGKAFDPAATYMGLFTAISDKGLNTALSDLTLAPGTLGPALAVGAWSAQYQLIGNQQVVDGPLLGWVPASSADECTVMGWYFASAASAGVLLGFGYLPAPVTLAYPDSALKIVPRLTLDPAGMWSAEVVIGS